MSGWRHARAIVFLPGAAAVVAPAGILLLSGAEVAWGLEGALAVLLVGAALGLLAAGFALWLWTVSLLAQEGEGTLAPWDPTQRLVVRGPYRQARNPMIAAVSAVLAGEAMLFGSVPLLIWAAAFFALNHANLVLCEEPGLERRFGDEYRAYKRQVPRWVPRLKP